MLHPLIAAAGAAPSGYQIPRSLRFRAGASTYLSRTVGTPTNQNIWTFSFWCKRGAIGGTYFRPLGAAPVGGSYDNVAFTSSDTIVIQMNNLVVATSTPVFRDPAAWYHIVISCDFTQVTATNRLFVYVNGVQIALTGTYPTLNPSSTTNNINRSGVAQHIGSGPNNNIAANFYDGQFAEWHFIDGQALSASSFGASDLVTDVWNPIKYTGTYGNNGYRLNFSDNSAVTAAALGADRSGNGNNYTPNNFSVTAGVTNDSYVDSPTNYGGDTGLGGEVRGNYCTFNPLDKNASVTLTDGNLSASSSAGSGKTVRGTFGVSSGKWYWECTVVAVPVVIGIATAGANLATYLAADANGWGYYYGGTKYNNAAGVAYGAAFANGDTVGIALDADNGTLTFYKNGVSQGAAFTGLVNGPYFPAFSNDSASAGAGSMNFGQRPFVNAAPTGYQALCTQNMPDPVIKRGKNYLDVSLYAGDTNATRNITGLNFQPDLVWIKDRGAANNHGLFDSVRGANKTLYSNLTQAEDASGVYGYVSAFNSDGYQLTRSGANGYGTVNGAGPYVGWSWKKGITPGFDIVTFTGTAVAKTVAHGLGVAPAMMIVKDRGAASYWVVYHKRMSASPQNGYTVLQLTTGYAADVSVWNNTAPTSSVFTVGSNAAVNGSGGTLMAYLWAEVPGFSKFGSYIGNGSADGPFVYCGFRPRWVMIKRTDSTGDWIVIDAARNTTNQSQLPLYPNTTSTEVSDAVRAIDILSNGFKTRSASTFANNVSGGTYIFAAFAETPFKYSRAR